MDTATLEGLEGLASALDETLLALGDIDSEDRRRALAVKDAIEEFYRAGLKQIVKVLRDEVPGGAEALGHLAADPVVRTLLLSAGILRTGPTERAHRALESIRPYLNSHGGDVELVKVEPPTAYVRLVGACTGCSMSALTLSEGVRSALVDAVEEISEIEVVKDELAPALVQMGATRHLGYGWQQGPRVEDIKRFGVHPFSLEGQDLIITSVDGKLACFRNECAHLGMELDRATVDSEGTMTCPWHGFRYDATSGECISAPGVELEQFPIRIEDGFVRVKMA